MTKPKFDLDSTTKDFTSFFKAANKKRNFPGATTKRGYGPVNAPKVTDGGGFTAGYGTGADPVVFGGDAGGGMGEGIADNQNEKFMAFLESLKTENNTNLIDTVKGGFETCLEAKKKWSQEVKVKKDEKPAEGTFTKKSGAIVKELMSKAEGNPGTAVQKINFYINRAGDGMSNKAEVMKAKKILEKKSEKK